MNKWTKCKACGGFSVVVSTCDNCHVVAPAGEEHPITIILIAQYPGDETRFVACTVACMCKFLSTVDRPGEVEISFDNIGLAVKATSFIPG
jgi:hypothetical protein